MLTSKTFLTKTKRGNILKIVREHYLRDDLWCGSFFCKLCKHKDTELLLEKKPQSISKLYDFPHYLLLDTNVILHQMDVLDEDVLKNVIILQTVLEEVKHRSAAIFKRLLEIVDNKKRRFYSFVNEHHQSTYVERLPGEKINDRNDRAIRAAASWYDRHLASGHTSRIAPRVILLTDDEGNRAKAESEGIMVCTVREYIKSLTEFPALEDKIARNVAPDSSVENALFPTHLSPVHIHEGIKNGKLYQGKFHASRENFLEGSASIQGFEKPILLQGHIGMNRSVDGDTVAVEIYPEEQWSKPSEIVLEDKAEDPGDQLDEEKLLEKIKEQSKKDQEIRPTGRVVGIIRRKWRQYCGILMPSMLPGATRHLFVPAERKIPRVRIETRQADVLISQRIVVALDSWPCNSRYPLGHFVRALGPIGDKNAENEVLLLEHDVPHARFSEAVLSCLPVKDWTIPPEELAKRVDLRSITVCSVDPPGCTDIDDALHARIKPGLPPGAPLRYEVGVHIADVTYFVRPETALDKEAASRSTTVYLVDRRIDMVPDLLSSNLCSLRGGEERLAFSCVWEVDENAHILATKFHKSVIKSAAAMTYEEAQLAIDDQHRHDEVASSLRILNVLAKKLKKKRLDNGALLLASPEIRFQVDSETHDPIDVETKRIRDTNSMVEEFMLLANVSVAERLVSDFPQCALLRRHPPPVPTMFETFIQAARQQGFEIDVATNASLARSLDLAVKPEQPYFNTLLRIMATRCMQQAVYFCSGQLTQDQFYHYGLACPIYTHFTSPIRRYADIMVHRLLAATIGADSTFGNMLDTRHATGLSDNLNYRHRQAQMAGRASVALNTHLMFRGRVTVESGVVLYVRRNAVLVLVPRYGLEAPLMLPADKFSYNDEAQTQQCGDIILRTFDEITVQLSLDSTNVQHQRLKFSLVKPHIEGFSVVPEEVAIMPDDTSDKPTAEDGDVEMKAVAVGEAKRKSDKELRTKEPNSKKSKRRK